MYDDKNRGYPYGGGYGGSYNPYGAPESARPENSLREPRKAGSEVGPYSDYRHSAYNSAMQNQPFIQPEASGVAEPLYGVSSEPEKKAKKKGAARAGLTAAILALALIGGALGGGVTAWYLGEINEPVAAVSHNEIPAQAQETQSAAPVAPVVVAEGDVTGVVEKAAPSVVEITLKGYAQTFFGVQESEGAGSGVILTEDGYVVTNNHVVEGGEEFTVRDHEGNEYTAELIGTDSKTDLAVIKIDASGLTPVTFGDSASVRVGQVSVVIGNPLGTFGGTVTNGVVSALDRELTIGDETMNLMQTSAAVNPGNSGGGLFDATGALIGIVNAKSSGLGIEGIGFAIPANTVREVTDDLMENGYVTGRPELGITVLQVDDIRAAAYYGFDGTGVFVLETTRPNGLNHGDRIVSINGAAVTASEDVSMAVSSSKTGDVLRMVIVRDGAEMTIDVTVGEQIPDSIKNSIPEPSDY